MDRIFGLLVLILIGGAGLISIFAILNLLLPAPVERARSIMETNLGRSLLLGLVNSVFAGAVLALLTLPTRAGGWIAAIFIFLALLILIALTILTMLGLVSLTSLLGTRIGELKSPVTTHLRGGALLVLACLTPYLGWFVFTPLVLWTSLGAGIQAMFRRKEKIAA